MEKDRRWFDTLDQWIHGQLTRDQLRQWHDEALQAVVSHVQDRSPFYKNHLRAIRPDELDLDGITALPFTTKADLRDAMLDMLCGSVADAAFYYETTGTTGRPTPCPKGALDHDLNYLPIADALKGIADKHFTGSERPLLAVLIPNDVHSACTTFAFAARHANIAKFDVFPVSPTVGFERFFEIMLELRVNMVVSSPGMLMSLAEMSDSYGVDVRDDLNVQVVLTTGEVCSEAMSALLAETWGATAYNVLYGSQEAGVPAVTGTDGILRVVDPTYLCEVLDADSGESLGFDGHGELCLTTLVPGIKPLIRYRTGDLVNVVRDAGTLRTSLQVLGRVKDRVLIGGKYRSAVEIENAILIDPSSIYGYDLDIVTHDSVDRLQIRLKAKDDANHENLKTAVRERVRRDLGVDSGVKVLPLLNLKSATGGWVSWKAARINDLRTPPADDDIEDQWAARLARAVEERI